MGQRTFKIMGFLGFLMAVSAVVVLASEGGHGGGSSEITFMGDWFPRLVNFGLITFVLVYFLRKPTRDFFKNRTAEIERALRESQEARDKAVAALADMERKIREMEAETKNLIAEAQARGEKDKQALFEEGKKAAKEIAEQVKVGIEIETAKAKADLANEASLLAVELAEGKIKSSINAQDHERIVKDYIANVGGRG
jgi:F-type H+-transporting ATPase subunit b